MKYSLSWRQLEKCVTNIEEYKETAKKMKMSKTTGLKKQTASKFAKKHGVGCRKIGAGRVDKFKHVKVRLKAWLEKEREHWHFVDKTDLCVEFMEMCADDSEACAEEMKVRSASTEEAAEVTIQAIQAEANIQAEATIQAEKKQLNAAL